MEQMQVAAERLEKALIRLERAVEAKAGGTPGAASESGQLQLALEAAKSENQELHQIARTVSEKLNSTIGRLQRVVGS